VLEVKESFAGKNGEATFSMDGEGMGREKGVETNTTEGSLVWGWNRTGGYLQKDGDGM